MSANTSSSQAFFERALRAIPGGVSSPVRAFGAVGGVPRVIARAEGAHVFDVDGNALLDFVGSWGPLICGHAHPRVVVAIQQAALRGTTYGAPCPAEIELAERLTQSYAGLERVRFVSSGTEATMSAIRVARGFTGRELLVKFAGCYHGHADSLLVSAGSGLATFGTPSSAGVPAAIAERTLVLELDDEDAVRALFAARGEEIAAVIVEPIPANDGLLLQRAEFLHTLRRETEAAGALLILDEVISGFRVGRGGAAELYGVTPDLATFGKVVGGGLPVGAFGGRRDVLAQLAPNGPVYQAGTLSGNPLAMAAGLATLAVLEQRQHDERDGWARLEALGSALEERLAPVLANAREPVSLVRVGSIFWLALQAGAPPRSAAGLDPAARERYKPIFHGLLARGIALAPSAYEVGFLSLAHEESHLDQLAEALAEVL